MKAIRNIQRNKLILFSVFFGLFVFPAIISKIGVKIYPTCYLAGLNSIAVIVSIHRYRQKRKKNIDIELASALTVVDQVARLYLHPNVSTINNIVIFIFVLMFIHRATPELKIGEHKRFLLSYFFFYLILNWKYLDVAIPSLWGITYSVMLAIVFSYSLLASTKSCRFEHCLFYGGCALLALLILGKRIYGTLDNAFTYAQIAVALTMIYSYIHWHNTLKIVPGSSVSDSGFTRSSPLGHALAAVLFLYYVFTPDIKNETAVWILIAIVSLWLWLSLGLGYRRIRMAYRRQLALIRSIAIKSNNPHVQRGVSFKSSSG